MEKRTKDKEHIYQVTLSESQLRLINKAVEQYFRMRIGQFSDYVDDIVFEGFNYKDHSDEEFDAVINRRDAASEQFKTAYRALTEWPKHHRKTADDQRLIDMWETIRHQFWLDKPEPKSEFTVDSRPSLNLSGDKPIKVRMVGRK